MEKRDIIINYIKDNINSGKYKPNSKIMSEADFAYYLKISRAIVREALSILENQGIIYRIRGSGTFISENINLKKNYIIIHVNETALTNDLGNFNKILIELLKEKITQNNYVPYLYIETYNQKHINFKKFNKDFKHIDFNFTLNIDDIAGIIYISKPDFDFFEKLSSPKVTINTLNDRYSNIAIDYLYFYKELTGLISKYKFKNIVFFTFKMYEFLFHNQDIINYAMLRYFKDQYQVYEIEISQKSIDIVNQLHKDFSKIKKSPDCFVFLHNVLYQNALNIFPEYEKIITPSKIITHSNNDEVYPDKYKICRLSYNIKDFSDNAVNLLLKLINKDYIDLFNIFLKCEIINEEVLKK
ncbi:MAG: winged helix-turn-helix transcriptional regulator [Abditibacteriota bacterium]|nr:winged helix-turn-helix transcriptional regulator [Abditibacteriota bacterium]